MSECEKFNMNVKSQMVSRRNEAIRKMFMIIVYLLLAQVFFVSLLAIGFISKTFMVILAAIAICIAAFKTGYVYRDVKF